MYIFEHGPPFHKSCRAVIVTETNEINFHGCWCEQMHKLWLACKAGEKYFTLLESCLNDPEKIATACTIHDEGLDDLYDKWMQLTQEALRVQ